MKPRVGTPSIDHRAVCHYSTRPGAPQCNAPATVHLLVHDADGYGMVGLGSCDIHAPIARTTGLLLDEHKHKGVCGLPGTLWNGDLKCCVLDDSGQEAVREVTDRHGVPFMTGTL
jgi:hypothetical protein